MSRAIAPQISFADLEFIHQRMQLEPPLRAIAAFLDTHASLVDGVRRDLERGLKHPATGRHVADGQHAEMRGVGAVAEKMRTSFHAFVVQHGGQVSADQVDDFISDYDALLMQRVVYH